MTRARQQIISTADTPYYHCISRCVRRAFLCGQDPFDGKSYEHRRQWVVERLTLLETVFCIDICAYAVMSNHYHLVLFINELAAEELERDQVIERWSKLFKGPDIIQRYRNKQPLDVHQLALVDSYGSAWLILVGLCAVLMSQ